MDLIHFGRVPLLMPLTCIPQADEPTPKPKGLWVSDESGDEGWWSWCQAEDFHLEQLAFRTRIFLDPRVSICLLDTPASLLRFTDDFGGWPAVLDAVPWVIKQGVAIDWVAVARDYQGILITPYHWSRRLDPRTPWYHGWDVAGGCIWDPSAIVTLERVSQRALPRIPVSE